MFIVKGIIIFWSYIQKYLWMKWYDIWDSLPSDLWRACRLSRFNRVWLFATLWTVAHQAPLSMGFSRQEYSSGVSCPSPGDLPDPGLQPTSVMAPALASKFFTTSTTWEAHSVHKARRVMSLALLKLNINCIFYFCTYLIFSIAKSLFYKRKRANNLYTHLLFLPKKPERISPYYLMENGGNRSRNILYIALYRVSKFYTK